MRFSNAASAAFSAFVGGGVFGNHVVGICRTGAARHARARAQRDVGEEFERLQRRRGGTAPNTCISASMFGRPAASLGRRRRIGEFQRGLDDDAERAFRADHSWRKS
jgi:hypothetical protein